MTLRRDVHAGFIPLTDCAPLVLAKELGFDKQHGIDLHLHKDVSWANIRDKAEGGLLDGAIMLAPMPLAATLGLGRRPPVEMRAAMTTSLNGNAITVSRSLYLELCAADEAQTSAGGFATARALAHVIAARRAKGADVLTFGMVYPFSSHNYDLRLWLASADIDPDRDVNLVVVPPPLIAESLKAGRIDGFCVGEPWNSVAVADGSGVIVATKAALWPGSPEKVLGLRADYAARNLDNVSALLSALHQACHWLDQPANRADAARLLAQPAYVGISADIIAQALTGHLGDAAATKAGDAFVFARDAANEPRAVHAVWLLTQMIRWGQVRDAFDIASIARTVFSAGLFQAATAGTSTSTEPPAHDQPPQFFSAAAFDADDPVGYLSGLSLRDTGVDLAAFARAQLTLG